MHLLGMPIFLEVYTHYLSYDSASLHIIKSAFAQTRAIIGHVTLHFTRWLAVQVEGEMKAHSQCPLPSPVVWVGYDPIYHLAHEVSPR